MYGKISRQRNPLSFTKFPASIFNSKTKFKINAVIYTSLTTTKHVPKINLFQSIVKLIKNFTEKYKIKRGQFSKKIVDNFPRTELFSLSQCH